MANISTRLKEYSNKYLDIGRPTSSQLSSYRYFSHYVIFQDIYQKISEIETREVELEQEIFHSKLILK
jgi:hypothetical protein